MRVEISSSDAADSSSISPNHSSEPPTLSQWSAARLIGPASPTGIRQHAKFFARALIHPKLTRAWLARLVQPDVAALWIARPRLAAKLQRPYVHCEWRPLERFA